MPYQHIEPLDSAALALADSEIPALVEVIADYRKYIPQESWDRFQQRLAREWAIETGQIEGLYQFDRGVTITLIEDGFTESRIPPGSSNMSPAQVAAILNDHLLALEFLFAFIKGERSLSKSFIHELHAMLVRNQGTHEVYAASTGTKFDKALKGGQYKTLPNNPSRGDGSVFYYCPPEQVEAEMDQLLALHRRHVEEEVSLEIQAAWLHHAFTQIHPYPDGNGRVARALATLVLIKGGLLPLVVPTAERERVYIRALERADERDYHPLVAAMRLWQGRLIADLSQRLELNAPAQTVSNLDEFLSAVKADMLRKGYSIPERWLDTDKRLAALRQLTNGLLVDAAAKLNATVKVPDWVFQIGDSDISASTLLDYGWHVARGKTEVLIMQTGSIYHVEVSLAQLGPKFRGLGIGVVALAMGSAGTKERTQIGDHFLITFAEPEESLHRRFNLWLGQAIVTALDIWRRNVLS